MQRMASRLMKLWCWHGAWRAGIQCVLYRYHFSALPSNTLIFEIHQTKKMVLISSVDKQIECIHQDWCWLNNKCIVVVGYEAKDGNASRDGHKVEVTGFNMCSMHLLVWKWWPTSRHLHLQE